MPSQGPNPATSHGGLRRAESNVTQRLSRWASVNTRQAARRPRSLVTIRRPDSNFQGSDIDGNVENEILDCYLGRIWTDENPEPITEKPPNPEPKLEPKPEPERRYKIDRADRNRPTGGMSVGRSESLRTHMKMHSEIRRSTQFNPSRSLNIPSSRARGCSEEIPRGSVYRGGGSSAKINHNIVIPASPGRGHDGGLTRSQTTKTSKEYATEYRTLLGERHRVSCYSPSIYSRATLVEAPTITGSVGQMEKRPVSEATTHWSMIDEGDSINPPIQPIPPLRIRKEKRRIEKA